ncbi:hypothetical protein AB4283_19990 [Vibrio splendidus]
MLKEKPRMGAFASSDGSYEQVLRLLTPVVDPGDEVIVEQLFTGYGEIKHAKLTFYPNDDAFFPDKSYILNGLYEKEENLFVFGKDKHKFENTGVTFGFGGMKADSWDESTLFFDVGGEESLQILTETKQIEAPFKYVLCTKNNLKPGTYSLEYYFTYFNGTSWKSSTRKIDFKVRNFLERHDVLIGYIAIAASLSALVRFVALPVGKWLCGFI